MYLLASIASYSTSNRDSHGWKHYGLVVHPSICPEENIQKTTTLNLFKHLVGLSDDWNLAVRGQIQYYDIVHMLLSHKDYSHKGMPGLHSVFIHLFIQWFICQVNFFI